MKRSKLLLISLATLLLALPVAAEPLRIAFIAYQNPDALMENVEPVVDYLEKTLGHDVKAFTATDYAAVVEALASGSADVGFMGPLQYVMARRQAGARPILGEVYNGSTTYKSRIFVRRDSGIKTLADLKGKTIAFVDPISSSGYLYPLDTFKSAGLIKEREDADAFFKRIYFAGGDQQAMEAVLNGFVDAAGVGQFSESLLRGNDRNAVIHIAESRDIPSHCVVVGKDVDEARAAKFRKALLALNEGPNRALLQHLYGVDGYVQVDVETYAEFEKVSVDNGFIPAPGK